MTSQLNDTRGKEESGERVIAVNSRDKALRENISKMEIEIKFAEGLHVKIVGDNGLRAREWLKCVTARVRCGA